MFKKILIANRGAIATRIIRTLREMNIISVVIYSDADRDSLHVTGADEAYPLGDGNVADTYLNLDKLADIIRQSGCDAVHPGYGFLSENPDLVQLCDDHAVVFLGPTTAQMAAFGLKHSARDLAEKNNVPLLPGTGLLENVEQAIEKANIVGYPLMLKSTAGGGGIGMQLCQNAQQLENTYARVMRISEASFSNNGIFIEKFVQHARHIEVQVFGDGQGNIITLGERDCSTQRRNQKVIEESPAPNIPDDVREQMYAVARRLCASVNYRSAGTVEYVYDPASNEFYFLEVNTRLQVEHGVTEQIFGVDLIKWMILLGANELPDADTLQKNLCARGHSIQVRLYAEDPNKNFQPSTGLLSEVKFPTANGRQLRIDHWIEAGLEISPFYDPMLAKIIIHRPTREQAVFGMQHTLKQTRLYGVETNLSYILQILKTTIFRQGRIYTRYLDELPCLPHSIDVLRAGTQTMIQDYPGRTGYWHVGIPPSGPFDSWSFRLGNRLLGNDVNCAGLEITLDGPSLKFNCDSCIVLTGAAMPAKLDGKPILFWQTIDIRAGQILELGKLSGGTKDAGARSYLLVKQGIQCPDYLGSKSTFTLGRFGGHAGRVLRPADVLHLAPGTDKKISMALHPRLLPAITHDWELHVIYGPHGAPDFFTANDIKQFFAANWEVHYNSSRTGIRLIGPKPEWARTDGGEAGMHPSNIHDNAYAVGTIDFTGDMPVILGPDGPSLGGFVCPATVIQADLWKLGQLKAGDRIRFLPVSIDTAVKLEHDQHQMLRSLSYHSSEIKTVSPDHCIIKKIAAEKNGCEVTYRASGDHYLLIEYGSMMLDINLRFRVHALMQWLQKQDIEGLYELTPGIRSLQVHYNSQHLSLAKLLKILEQAESSLVDIENQEVDARIVHLPISWDDDACQQAIEKYMQSVRKDAPWCPSNIEFIRRINGLDSIEDVKKIVFDASYVVMGLGDVYLGAPVATPLDPRHRLVTTKYNPARTWTAENSVGIGGSYLCVYGMEGPGGYQFIGRTLQMWNAWRQTKEFTKPWLLRFFDQIRFYEVSADELKQIRQDFPKGRYPLKIEPTRFSLKQYNQYLHDNQADIDTFTTKRQRAFDEELQRWIASGQIHFESESALSADIAIEEVLDDHEIAIESHIAGNVWKILVKEGQHISAGEAVAILESMKMEIEVIAPEAGTVVRIQTPEASQVHAGQRLIILTLDAL